MATPKKQTCRKKEYQKINFDLKLSIIDEINNGQISVNYVSKKYGISRSISFERVNRKRATTSTINYG